MAEGQERHLTRPIPQRAANELAAALVARLAAEAAIRTLLLKGFAEEIDGLRPARAMADVDILIAPGDAEAFRDTLAKCGWVQRPEIAVANALVAHSDTYSHPEWPCDIDVHRYFPGVLAPAQRAFEVLWDRRRSVELADVRCDVTDPVATILVAVLHAYRHGADVPRHREKLGVIARRVDRDGLALLDDVRRLAFEIGAEGPMAPWFADRGIEIVPRYTEGLDGWWRRHDAGDSLFSQLLAVSKGMKPAARARLMWRGAWPTRSDLIALNGGSPVSMAHVWRLRVARLARGAKEARRMAWRALRPRSH